MTISSIVAAAIKLLVLLAAFAVGVLMAEGAEPQIEIRLRGSCEVSGGVVRLGDVAEVRGLDSDHTPRWLAVRLGPAPRTGEERLLGAREIQDVLELSGAPATAYRFTGARTIRIRAAANVSPIASAVAAATASSSENPNATPAAQMPTPELLPVVHARRPIARGQVLSEADLAVQWVDAAQVQRDALSRPEELIGKEATRNLNSGQALIAPYVRRPILVERNDLVKLIARTAGIRVTVDARSLGEGSAGDLIEVQPIESKETLLARVVERKVVEIYSRGPTVPASPATPNPVQSVSKSQGGVR